MRFLDWGERESVEWLDRQNGLESDVTVTLQDLTIESAMEKPWPRVTLTDWDGWINSATPVGGAIAFNNADGGIEGDVYFGGLSIRLEGAILARNASELTDLMCSVGSVLTNPRWDILTVRESRLRLNRQIEVARASRPLVTRTSRSTAIYTLNLQSADARRVDVEESRVVLSAGEQRSLVNAGDASADLTARLVGPLTSTTIVHPDGAWRYTEQIAAGTVREVDFTRRTVVNPATGAHSRVKAAGVWPRVQPGSSSWSLSTPSTGSVELAWRSSWS